jgi:hypothetical protein
MATTHPYLYSLFSIESSRTVSKHQPMPLTTEVVWKHEIVNIEPVRYIAPVYMD